CLMLLTRFCCCFVWIGMFIGSFSQIFFLNLFYVVQSFHVLVSYFYIYVCVYLLIYLTTQFPFYLSLTFQC
ncbi:hypothetical protein BY996DRAFT_6651591, partial [Phakopsora pachyrhizi]